MPLTKKTIETITPKSLEEEQFSYSLNNTISNRLTQLLAGNTHEAFQYEKWIVETVGIQHTHNKIAEQLTKLLLINKCSSLLTKEEESYYRNQSNRSIDNFIKSMKNKIDEKEVYDNLEENKDFKAYTTTFLLAEKMCSELGIQNSSHEKFGILESYLKQSRPQGIQEAEWIHADDSFFEQKLKQKKAKNPITFIDLTQKETLREDPIHVKMWLYTLMTRKDKKADEYFYTMNNNDIATFSLKEDGYRLFERIFNAGCQLHRALINDPNEQEQIYIINSINDIHRILTGQYKQPGNKALSNTEKQNLDGFIDVTECLFHIGSHRLRGKSGKKEDDQFVQLVEKQRNFNDTKTRSNLFNVQTFWHEVLESFSQQIDGFGLIVDDGSNKPLNAMSFMNYLDQKTLKRSIPVKDKIGNKYIFSGRCKELDSMVNKMLNTSRYSHIDGFNDILASRIELIQAAPNCSNELALCGITKEFIHTKGDNKIFNHFKFKGDYVHMTGIAEQEGWNTKLRKEESENGIVNGKTEKGYSEIKFLFKGFEIQLCVTGNNNKGKKDDSNYGFKKMVGLSRRIKESIALNTIYKESMNRWIRTQLTDKRYALIKKTIDAGTDKKTIIESNLIYDMCTIQLIHEILLEELHEPGGIVSGSILYQFAKKILPLTQGFTDEYFSIFEKQYTEADGSFNISMESLQKTHSPVGKAIVESIANAANAAKLYESLLILKNKTHTKRTQLLSDLDNGNMFNDQTKQFLVWITENRITKQKNTIKNKINGIYTGIGGGNYSQKINTLIHEIEQGKCGENLAKWIFRDALLDKKNAQVTHSVRARGKRLIQLIGNGVINKLNGILHESGTFISIYPELDILLKQYEQLVTFNPTTHNFEAYRQGKSEFFANNDTLASTYYQDMYKTITNSGDYEQYITLINTYLNSMIENEIAKTAERAEKGNLGEIIANKMNPAKIAWIQKMYKHLYQER